MGWKVDVPSGRQEVLDRPCRLGKDDRSIEADGKILMLDIPGLDLEPVEKKWKHIPSFLNRDDADSLYEKLESMQFTPHPTDGSGAFYKTIGSSYSGRGTNFEPVEDIAIPQGWRNLADRVGKESQSPVNYIQIHRFSPIVPVRPHFDPGGMVVPMLTVR
jgi:hypothetical protein